MMKYTYYDDAIADHFTLRKGSFTPDALRYGAVRRRTAKYDPRGAVHAALQCSAYGNTCIRCRSVRRTDQLKYVKIYSPSGKFAERAKIGVISSDIEYVSYYTFRTTTE